MRSKKNREIIVFSTSAIDLFASSMGAFVVIVVILFPYFGKKHKDPPPQVEKIQELESELATLKDSKIELEKKKVELEEINKKTETDLIAANELITQLQLKIDESTTKEITDTENSSKMSKQLEEKAVQIKKLEETIAELKVKTKVDAPKSETVPKETYVKDIRTIQDKVDQLAIVKKDLEKENDDLKNEIKKLSSSKNISDSNFLAIVVQWTTQKHDIDISIKDPNKKVFNFKQRKHAAYKGEFTLDSRTGPGVEMFQTDAFHPGQYEIAYQFYNHYGNNQPASISTIIYTRSGSFQLKNLELDFNKQKNVNLVFKIDSKANVLVN